ncbi:MAG TPA: DNA polymerase/3'-5' exonuclease PolX [Candidatus Baltobacteraceae bacterium]|nr:DNA polymerase/3'-5' exonuclease PolX [Candidatus Baltobacteraceae bacterium]
MSYTIGVTNAEIAQTLMRMRTLMELSGESFYKFMAYERAAAALENAAPAADLIAAGELLALPGIGKTLSSTIEEIVRTGTCEQFVRLQEKYPATIFEVLGVSGIGIKTAAMLFEQFQIGSLAQLEAAIDSGLLETAPRMGRKTIENIRRGILAYRGRQRRTPLARALELAREIMAYVGDGPPVHRLAYAGSLRRAEVTVGDIDVVCTSDEAAAVIDRFVTWERARAVLAEGPTKASIWLEDGLQIDLRVLPDHLYGNLLQHFTGSREHNIQLREYAVRQGLRVSENGILRLENGEVVTCRDEAGVYETLGMQYVPPELRSGTGEIELALRREIPQLVELGDVRGDFHMHCTYSDGNQPLEEMVRASAERGYQYHSISDHSQGRGRNYGVTVDRLREQRAQVRALGERYGVRTLCSSEVDILPDGSMDYPDEVLRELDIVIGSVHSAFNIGRDAMTARLIRACENPHVTIIGHPTGRMLDGFPGYEFDYDAVFAAAARTGTALEIDGQAMRLDLPSALVARARTFGVTFTTDSDAHDVSQLRNVELAVSQARRGGLTAGDVLNTRPVEDVLAFVRNKRERPA